MVRHDLMKAIEWSRFEAFASLGRPPYGEVQSDPELVRIVTRIPVLSPLSSAIFRAQFSPDDTDRQIDQALSEFAERRLPVIWNTGPSTRPRDLPRSLVAHGWTPLLEPTGMAARLDALHLQVSALAALEIEPVMDADRLKHWAEVFVAGFGVAGNIQQPVCQLFAGLALEPDAPWRLFLGVLTGKPVATSALYCGAGVAGIYFVTTLPQARQRGIGAAVTSAALAKATALGYDTAVLHASPMGLGMYARLGFQTYCRLGLFAWTPDAQRSIP
jgi:ribosomal protein S18 acetylase RimI-like enzyme